MFLSLAKGLVWLLDEKGGIYIPPFFCLTEAEKWLIYMVFYNTRKGETMTKLRRLSYTNQEWKTGLEQVKEMCDFMLENRSDFSKTERELDCLIEVLAALKDTALIKRACE